MDDDRLDARLRTVMARSIDEAARRGAAAVEAEHLLLATAGVPAVGAAFAGIDSAALIATCSACNGLQLM